MRAAQIDLVRQFNRLVTQRVGALDDHFLGRDRPLGASRLLYEIGDRGADLRDLRWRLNLDAGYVSRVLGNRRPETSNQGPISSARKATFGPSPIPARRSA